MTLTRKDHHDSFSWARGDSRSWHIRPGAFDTHPTRTNMAWNALTLRRVQRTRKHVQSTPEVRPKHARPSSARSTASVVRVASANALSNAIRSPNDDVA